MRVQVAVQESKKGKFGEILGKINSGIEVITGEGALIITKLQPECKKEQDAGNWFNGARVLKGEGFDSISPERATPCECEEKR